MNAETSLIRILVADYHPVVRQGVAGLVDGQPDMSIVGQPPTDARRSTSSVRIIRTLC
jgi:DNA-binding NarL/FixJ family response regulator